MPCKSLTEVTARQCKKMGICLRRIFTDLIKHSKMGKAEEYLSQARYYLQQFQKELRDVAADDTIQLQTGDFLSFADFFFDGVVDHLVSQGSMRQEEK